MLFYFFLPHIVRAESSHATWWPVQSIDTMKYSRDTARDKLNNSEFDAIIDSQLKKEINNFININKYIWNNNNNINKNIDILVEGHLSIYGINYLYRSRLGTPAWRQTGRDDRRKKCLWKFTLLQF